MTNHEHNKYFTKRLKFEHQLRVQGCRIAVLSSYFKVATAHDDHPPSDGFIYSRKRFLYIKCK